MAGFSRRALAIALSFISFCLLWYSICTYRISGKTPSSIGDFSAGFFPDAQLLNGLSRSQALDSTGAAECYKRAIFEEPSLLDAWMGLIQVRIEEGRQEEASRLLAVIAPALASVSTWKWRELLFAYDLRDERNFEQCFNYILSWLPHRLTDAGWIGARFWGGWQEVLPHVYPSNRPVFLHVLMDMQQVDASVALSKVMEKEGAAWDEQDALRLCDFLISNDRVKEAKAIWRRWIKNGSSPVQDGRFENQPLNRAFGWRFNNTDPHATVERLSGPACSESSCLHIHFKGTGNPGCDLVSQLVPVEPATSYCLRFIEKSRNLTTDRGVFVVISAYRHGVLNVSSEPALGDSPWKDEKICFEVPVGCEAILLQVRRDESLKFDNRISGDYWLGSVELTKRGNR